MANVRNLKKDINYVLGDIIEAAYVWELTNPSKDNKKSEAIIEEAIATPRVAGDTSLVDLQEDCIRITVPAEFLQHLNLARTFTLAPQFGPRA